MINSPARHIALDTETTGFGVKNNKIIEIGAIEFDPETGLLNGKRFYTRLNPNMVINPMATRVHGMTTKDLKDEPLFGHVADDFLKFIQGGHLVIHNAPRAVELKDNLMQKLGCKDGEPLQIKVSWSTEPMTAHKGDFITDQGYSIAAHNMKDYQQVPDPAMQASTNALAARLKSSLNVDPKMLKTGIGPDATSPR